MKKNMKWILLGVLGFVLFIGFIILIVMFVMKMMKGDAYHLSLAAITESSEVVKQFGEPLHPSWYVLGNVITSGADGSASLEYSIEGSRSSGKVYVYATRSVGEWVLDKVVVLNQVSGERIQVLDEAK
ncbi:cytochrome c oxidase assembly factor Coa1 family protein [Gynuella sp.]|uniref:cytochrome c oxidase assembly factor Coa1 family protein n=1 Tax=Gynuella sp. TaxID=2969146 RepID=UPI003D14AB64